MLLQTSLVVIGSLIAISTMFCCLHPVRDVDVFRI
jgi:hypothetical protein